MEILKIKHRLLIYGTWETLILESNEPRVYVQKTILYTKKMFEKEKYSLAAGIYPGYQLEQIQEIFDKDWSGYV